jgi:electron transfer flavoprotein alpha subunit
MSILIVAELRDGEVRSSNYPVIAAAKALGAINGATYDILALGKGAAAAAQVLKGFGAANVFYSEADVVADYTAEAHAAATAAVVADKGAKVVMTAATTTGKDMMPRLAGLIGAGMVSDVIGFEADGYLRPMYAGNAIGKIAVDTDVAVMTVRETAFDAAAAGGDAAVSEVSFDVDAGSLKARFVEYKLTESGRPDLAEASIIVSGGRGVKDADGMKVVEELADLLGAAVGASRAVVDEGIVPNDLQVGQTGKIVAPDLYIACGISGALQHVAGIKDSKVIVAINKDEEAPIFEVADYGLVGDMHKVLPELIEKIKAAKG